jgi:Rps23 Pro-64 3,4-dihydroxylase Tpa1-like proline 4-hydroxylase
MNVDVRTHPFPYAIIDDFYTLEELLLIWQEIDFLKPKLLSPEQTEAGKTEDNKGYKKNGLGVMLDDVYQTSMRGMSNILTFNRKLYMSPELTNGLIKASPIFGYLNTGNQDVTLLNYYPDGGYYKAHADTSCLSACTFLCKAPDAFTGGEFTFPDFDLTIESINNRLVIFPSCVLHEVMPTRNSKEGRYSIAQFLFCANGAHKKVETP